MTNTGLMEKIQKLASLAERAGTIHEAAAANAKLTELLLRHNLSMSDVYTANLRDKYTMSYLTIGGKDNWRRQLYHLIAINNLCKMVYIPGTETIQVVGTSENIEAVGFMYDRLSVELVRLCETEFKTFKALGGYVPVKVRGMRMNRDTGEYEKVEETRFQKVHGRKWKNSFMFGAVDTIGKLLREQRQSMMNNSDTNALVIDRESELDKAADDYFGKVTRSGGNTKVDSSAYGAGGKAAGRINFNESVGGGYAALGSGS